MCHKTNKNNNNNNENNNDNNNSISNNNDNKNNHRNNHKNNNHSNKYYNCSIEKMMSTIVIIFFLCHRSDYGSRSINHIKTTYCYLRRLNINQRGPPGWIDNINMITGNF